MRDINLPKHIGQYSEAPMRSVDHLLPIKFAEHQPELLESFLRGRARGNLYPGGGGGGGGGFHPKCYTCWLLCVYGNMTRLPPRDVLAVINSTGMPSCQLADLNWRSLSNYTPKSSGESL